MLPDVFGLGYLLVLVVLAAHEPFAGALKVRLTDAVRAHGKARQRAVRVPGSCTRGTRSSCPSGPAARIDGGRTDIRTRKLASLRRIVAEIAYGHAHSRRRHESTPQASCPGLDWGCFQRRFARRAAARDCRQTASLRPRQRGHPAPGRASVRRSWPRGSARRAISSSRQAATRMWPSRADGGGHGGVMALRDADGDGNFEVNERIPVAGGVTGIARQKRVSLRGDADRGPALQAGPGTAQADRRAPKSSSPTCRSRLSIRTRA